jgi:hypothetical protein
VVVLEAGQSPVTPPLLESLRRVNTRVFQISAPAGRKDGGWAAAQVDAVRAFQPGDGDRRLRSGGRTPSLA